MDLTIPEASTMRFFMALLCLAFTVVPVALAAASKETHPFGVRDLVAFDRLSDARVSPDGKWVVFTISALDLDANKRRTDLWLVAADGTGLRPLTRNEASDTSAAWSKDGRTIFFLSTRGGSSQVWKLSLDGGESQPVTSLPLDVGSFVVSPDGTKLALSMEVYPGTSPAETKKRLDDDEKKKASGKIYDSLFFRHWDTWGNGTRSHIFVVPVAGGEAVDVMKAMDADAPSKPFGGSEEYTFTPDGASVVFSARDVGREEAWSTNFDLFVAPAGGGSAPRNLTSGNKAWDGYPVFSPDGKTLAYTAMKRPGYEADRFRIVLRSWPDGQDRILTEGWDRSPSDLAWSPDGKEIYCLSDDVGHHALFAVDAATGKVRTVVGKGHVTSPQPSGARVFYLLDSMKGPAELYSVKADGGDAKKLTSINDERLAATRRGDPEQFSFKGANGDDVYCWIVKPIDFDPAKTYPVAFLIHGGPQGSFGNDFHYRWNPQAYAGRGYAAVMVDFHGSTGYGQAFTDAINGDWGGKPLEDLQKGLAAALAKYKWMDGNRVAALGASYGGWMINWIAGKWPDRFKCLVVHDGNLDEQFAYFATEELWFPEWEHGGTPWEHPEGYAKDNPVQYVKNWKTPTLVIHGGKDYRVVDTGGFATFTALQRMGIPSKFLYFPDENHWVLKPANSILWHDTVLDWIDQWTKRDGKP
ncbi:MAG TPA: S9 family peptidase [Candidatus Polarisedimenticolaceae bacterium]|nr:S9 family peptidase [Candidatus Polarisedimenticolaceae bacterium]